MGKEIFERNVEKEVHENNIDMSLFRKKSSAKTFVGWLIGKIKQAKNDENPEIMRLLMSIHEKYIELEKKRFQPVIELEIIEGWKGKDFIKVYEGFTNNFIIKSHTKNKETGDITTQTHQIPYEDVNKILFWIKRWKVGETHKCYDFAKIIGEKDWKEVWKKRTDVYFPLYYYPIKILESIGIIKYSGRGTITKIK